MNFFVKMALKHAAAGAARAIRAELNTADARCGPDVLGERRRIAASVFREQVSSVVGAMIMKMDPDKLMERAEGIASWLEKESGGGA